MIHLSTEQRAEAMRLMRAYGAPDEAIAQAWNITRQRVHAILGARPRSYAPALEDPEPSPEAFARVLRAWRTRRGMTQVQAAAALGLPGQPTVSNWERNGACDHPRLVMRLLDLLDQHEPHAT